METESTARPPPITVDGRMASTITIAPPPDPERWVELGPYEHPASGRTVSRCRSYLKEMTALAFMSGTSALYQWGPIEWQNSVFTIGLFVGLVVTIMMATMQLTADIIVDSPHPYTCCLCRLCFRTAQCCGYLPSNLVIRGKVRPRTKPRITSRPRRCCWMCCGGETYDPEL
jgi:hypothetical protein